jgi:hypothetical protein
MIIMVAFLFPEIKLIEGQSHELLERDPVVDLVFQLRVGIDSVPYRGFVRYPQSGGSRRE